MPLQNDPTRRDQLAVLYAALAKDLVDWKARHPGEEEDPSKVASPADMPVVFLIHHELTLALHEERKTNGDAEAKDLAAKEDLSALAGAVNKVLAGNHRALGGGHELRAPEVRRLILLMLDHANGDLAPYLPPATVRGW